MKKLIVTFGILSLLCSCEKQDQRYKTSSENIENTKKGLKAYEEQDWETWKSIYADDAEIFANNWDEASSPDEVLNWHKSMISELDNYKWREEPQFYEEIVDDDGKTWVYYWGVWEGKLTGSDKQLNIPVQLSSLIEDGKVTEEYGFWNMADLMEEENKIKNMTVEERQLLTKADDFVDKFLNQKDPNALDDLLADNYVRYMNDEMEAQGKQGLIDGMGVFHQAFPDLKITNETRNVKGNSMFVHWTLTGTNTGEFMGVAPTGKKVKISGMSEVKFDGDGKIYEEHVYYNQLDLMRQLGHELSPPVS